MLTFSLERPIAAAFGLLLAAGLHRSIHIFLLRLDVAWGEIVASKIAGVAILLGFLAASGAGGRRRGWL